MFKSVISTIVGFFKSNLSYDAIVSDFNHAIQRLDAFVVQETANAKKAFDEAAALTAKATGHQSDAEQAARTKAKLADLVS